VRDGKGVAEAVCVQFGHLRIFCQSQQASLITNGRLKFAVASPKLIALAPLREAIEFFHHERGQRAVNVRTRFLCIEAQLARVNAGTSSTHSNLQGCWGLPST
jgi:hypothetical protein